jgi:hypothetical protein
MVLYQSEKLVLLGFVSAEGTKFVTSTSMPASLIMAYPKFREHTGKLTIPSEGIVAGFATC